MSEADQVQTVSGAWLQLAPGWLAAGKPAEACPVSNTVGHKVKQVTLGNHLRLEHWAMAWEEGVYFCSDLNCPLIYYNNARSRYFTQDEIRTRVGIKAGGPPVPVCYCMNVTEAQIVEEIQVKRCCTSVEEIKQYTRARTGKLCHVTNPAGKCCGKHVTQVVERALAGITDLRLAEQARDACCEIPEE